MIRSSFSLLMAMLLAGPVVAGEPEAKKATVPKEDKAAADQKDFAKELEETADMETLAGILVRELAGGDVLVLTVKDEKSLKGMVTSFETVRERVSMLSRRVAALPLPAAEERTRLGKLAHQLDDKAQLALKSAEEKHLATLPAELQEAIKKAQAAFAQSCRRDMGVFRKYFALGAGDGQEETKDGAKD